MFRLTSCCTLKLRRWRVVEIRDEGVSFLFMSGSSFTASAGRGFFPRLPLNGKVIRRMLNYVVFPGVACSLAFGHLEASMLFYK